APGTIRVLRHSERHNREWCTAPCSSLARRPGVVQHGRAERERAHRRLTSKRPPGLLHVASGDVVAFGTLDTRSGRKQDVPGAHDRRSPAGLVAPGDVSCRGEGRGWLARTLHPGRLGWLSALLAGWLPGSPSWLAGWLVCSPSMSALCVRLASHLSYPRARLVGGPGR